MNGASGSTLRSWAIVWRRLLPLIVLTLLVGALSLWAYRVFSVEILAAIEQHALTVALTLATLLALILLYGAGFELWRRDRRRRAAAPQVHEEQLRRREQQTRRLLDAILTGSTDAIFAKDREGRYLLANPACAEYMGLTVEQILGRRDDELLRPDASATIREDDQRVLAGETIINLEQRLVLPGGEGTYLTTKAPLRDAEGSIVGLYGIARDISERQRQEAERRDIEATAARLKDESRWKNALDMAGHGVWDWHIDTSFLDLSPAWKQMLGYDEADIGNDMSEWSSRVHPDDLAETLAAVQAHLAAETPGYTSVHRMRCKDGRWKWVLDCGAVFERDAAGKPLRMLGTHTDITAQKAAEERLRESEERMRQKQVELEAIYTTAPVGLFVLDREMRFQRLNERLAEMNGLPVANHLGRRAGDILPALADSIEPPFQQVLTSGEPLVGLEVDGHTPAAPGSRRFWRVNYSPLKKADGQIVGINGVVEEITKLKHIEEEIRALNTELEAKVEARTAEARAASAAKSEFLAHMSHEIRTPLNAVLGLVQVMEQSPLNPEQRDLIAHIHTAGRSLLLLLNDILDFSKIEAGQLQLDSRPFVPAPLLEQLDSLLGLTARAKGLRFAIDAASLPGGALVGDPLRLEQILTNLIGNAIKFTDRGEVRLRLRTLEESETHARLRFEITDTGIGIAPEALPLLFAAFNQGDSGISRRFGGTGLGLAISKRLVELMGGTIGVESRAGAGSTFWFELPFARADAPVVSVTSDPATIAAGLRLRGGHYLIVDDNALNLDVLERMLALHGARATRAGDGRAALERLRTGSEDFDAVLMDVQMPVLDGLSATRAIRGELGLTALPVIAVTAGVLKDEQQRAHEAGVDAVLAKPMELDQLAALLSRWAPRAAVEPEAEAVPTSASGDPGDGIPAAALPVIVGLDPAHVARLTHGDIAFYRRLLSGLVAEVRGVPEELRAALASGAATEAAARLHRLRGVAANVGAVELAATLLELETALHEGRPVLPADLETFETQVATLLASADPWLAQTEPTPSAEPSVGDDAELDPSRLAALREALAANRPRPARQLFAELQPGLSRHYGPAATRAIAAPLAALDFPAALRALDAALSDTAAAPQKVPS